MRTVPQPWRLMAALGIVLASACESPPAPLPSRADLSSSPSARSFESGGRRDTGLKKPALISIDLNTGELVYWPTKKGPSQNPISFSKPLGVREAYAMAANGNVVVLANYSPPVVLLYDVKSKKTTHRLNDSYGQPLDVAVGKDGTIYVMNLASVTAFAAGSYSERQLTCSYISTSEGIGVDNQSDVFVGGYGPNSFLGVVEYPANGKACKVLQLQPVEGYIGGVGIDPITDDLLVVDNPDLCAGGEEGRLTIYPRPYRATKYAQVDLNAQYCGGTFRLDKGSKNIYLSDATVSDGFPLIDVRAYASGAGYGYYSTGYGDQTGGFTTVPNTLPN